MKKLVLLDSNHLMHRAYWAIQRNLSTSSGEQTNAVFGVASMLLKILEREHPAALIACFDEGRKTLRHREHAGYKAGRPETPDDFYAQIPRVRQCLEAYGIPVLSSSDYEADDLIGTLARKGAAEGFDVTIVSGDKDLFQTVAHHIRVAVPDKGYSEPQYLDAGGVKEKLGVTPAQVPDYKGLVGDPSDNLKGVKGIGSKTAAELLRKYGTLEGVYDHLLDVKRSVREKLKAGQESAFFCRKMATLVTDVPTDVNLEGIAGKRASAGELARFFAELEFHTLKARFRVFLTEDEFAREYFALDMTADVSESTEKKHPINEGQLPTLD